MTTPERLNALIESTGVRKKNLCEAINLPQSSLSTWLANNPTSIPSEYVMPICRFFGIVPEQLLCDLDDQAPNQGGDLGRLTDEEQLLLTTFRQVGLEGQRMIVASAIQEKRRCDEK